MILGQLKIGEGQATWWGLLIAFQPSILPSSHLLQIKTKIPLTFKYPSSWLLFHHNCLEEYISNNVVLCAPIYWRFSFTEDKMAENCPLLQFFPLKMRDMKEKMLAFTLIPIVYHDQSIYWIYWIYSNNEVTNRLYCRRFLQNMCDSKLQLSFLITKF